jgi:hypothetical protein|tara:strand:- start:221 stop:451 length:231 start_codon:yes stop_codon:yes gene_type:complete
MKLWFKNRRLGIGWYPCSWEGWVTILVYLILVVVLTNTLLIEKDQNSYIFALFVITGLLIIVSYKKGEKLSWKLWK